VIHQAKTIAIAGISTITVVGGGMWYVIENYLDTYVADKVHSIIDEKNGKQSFREILGEQMNVPTDVVPYHITKKMEALDSLIKDIKKFEEEYLPYLEFQMSITPIYRYIDENGQEWWSGPDGRGHGVVYDNGDAWCVYHGERYDLCDCK